MQPSKKFAFDIGITSFASVINMLFGFIQTSKSLKSLTEFFDKTFLKSFRRYLGASDLGLYRMTSTIYRIAMLVAAIGIPAAMIKYVAEFKDDRTKINQIVSSGVITSLFLGFGFIALFYFTSGIFAGIFNMPGLSALIKILSLFFLLLW